MQSPGISCSIHAVVVTHSTAAALQRAGGVGLNASTSHDATKYFVSLPQNKLEVRTAVG